MRRTRARCSVECRWRRGISQANVEKRGGGRGGFISMGFFFLSFFFHGHEIIMQATRAVARAFSATFIFFTYECEWGERATIFSTIIDPQSHFFDSFMGKLKNIVYLGKFYRCNFEYTRFDKKFLLLHVWFWVKYVYYQSNYHPRSWKHYSEAPARQTLYYKVHPRIPWYKITSTLINI